MLIFGTFEFVTANVNGSNVRLSIVHDVVKQYNEAYTGMIAKDTIIENHQNIDYVDTEEFDGMVVFSASAFNKNQFGINEADKHIMTRWDLSDLQEHFESDGIPDDVLWELMKKSYHKTGAIDLDEMTGRVWDYLREQQETLKLEATE